MNINNFKSLNEKDMTVVGGGKGIHSWQCAIGFGGGVLVGFASLNPYIFAASTISSAKAFCD